MLVRKKQSETQVKKVVAGATSEKPAAAVAASVKPADEDSDLRGKLKEVAAQRDGVQKKCNELEKTVAKQQAIIDALDEKFENYEKIQEETAVLADEYTADLQKQCQRWHKLYQHYLAKYEDTIVG